MAKVNMAGPAGSLKVEEKDVHSYESRGYVVTDEPKEEPKVDEAKTKTKRISKPKAPVEKKAAGSDDK